MAGATSGIDMFEFARRGACLAGELGHRELSRLGPMLAGAPRLQYTLRGHVDARGRPAARLTLAATLPLRCDRCGLPLPCVLDHQADFYFVASAAELDAIPIDDEPSEPLLAETGFDPAALAEDEAILALPISPRHTACPAPAAEAGAAASAMAPAADRPREAERQLPFAGLAQMLRGRPRRGH